MRWQGQKPASHIHRRQKPSHHPKHLFPAQPGQRPLLPLDLIRTTAAGSLLFDGSRAIEELGMRYTPLREALTEAVADVRAA